jgi:putative Mn2+ efflux pump MntP
MLALLLVAASLGLSNFAASIAIGISGVDRQLRVRVALAFGLFECGMPILGPLLGRKARTRSARTPT